MWRKIVVTFLVSNNEKESTLSIAKSLFQVRLRSKEVSDLIMLAAGAFSPLRGFLCKKDYEEVVANMHLKNGLLWPIPITLAVSREKAQNIKENQEIALINGESDEIIGGMIVEEKYS